MKSMAGPARRGTTDHSVSTEGEHPPTWWKSMVRNGRRRPDSAVVLARDVWNRLGRGCLRRPTHRVHLVSPAVPPDQLEKRSRPNTAARRPRCRDPCPLRRQGQFTGPRMFNGLMKTYLAQWRTRLHYLRQRPQGSSSASQPDGLLPTQTAVPSRRSVGLPQRDHAGQLHL